MISMLKEKLFEYQGLFYIVLSNLLPLYFVASGRADVFTIVFLYWMESLVVGVFAALRMAFAGGEGGGYGGKFSMISFFTVHYFFFILGQLIFLFAFMGDFISPEAMARTNFKMLLSAMFLSHAMAFVGEYLINGRYLKARPFIEMFRPYGRVIVQQIVVIAGAFLLARTGAPIAAHVLVLFVVVKTIADIGGYFIGSIVSK